MYCKAIVVIPFVLFKLVLLQHQKYILLACLQQYTCTLTCHVYISDNIIFLLLLSSGARDQRLIHSSSL